MQSQLPILQYNLGCTLDQSSRSIVLPSNASMHKVNGLIPGSKYTISLSADNRLGTGPGHVQVVTTLKGQTMHMLVRMPYNEIHRATLANMICSL